MNWVRSARNTDSLRQRLLSLARARGEDFQFVLDRFAVERLLYRLSISAHRDDFMLKGAMLFALWFDAPHRPTRDADFLGRGSPDPERLRTILLDLCEMDVDDGLVFENETLRIIETRDGAEYDGLRANLVARLGTARCNVQWDVGFGDAVTPGPQTVDCPTILEDFPHAVIQAYPRESMFAEKLEAMAKLGIVNSRMKDYFDLSALVQEGALSIDTLRTAVQSTFNRRRTDLPSGIPVGLSDAFLEDAEKVALWRAFLARNRLEAPPLADVVRQLRAFVTDNALFRSAARR